MKRSLKALLVSAAIVASLFVSASPASANSCIGFYMDNGQLQNAGYWQCAECPNPPYYGPLDGRWYLVICAGN